MNKTNTLINNFSSDNLIAFLRSSIPSFKPENEELDHLFPEDICNKYESIVKIGEAKVDKDDLIVIASKTTEPLTERTGKKNQYEIAKKILKHEVKDAALFVFFDSKGNFRFSFVKANYLGTKREFTEYKRYTYFVSPKQTNKTFIKQVGSCGFSSLDEIIEAFSVEPLNKQFYQEIAKAFYELIGGKYKQGTKTINADNPQLVLPSTPLKDNRKIYQEFAVRLIGRTIFCWFLKNKKSEAGIPLIPETWLSSNTVVDVNNQQHDYYHSVLEKLFFLVLNKREEDRKDYTLPQDANIIPFLNGGLFEAHPDDFFPTDSQGIHQISFGLKIPNSWFLELFKVLEQYNFTIDENSIYDAEVSIDPEMLGTIFENLLAEIDPDTEKSARKATGSFYTPREIVDYMVEQSLVQYLKTKTAIEDEEALERLFKEGQETNEEDTFSTKEKDQILQALSDVKILDPACGSGAFPMGALHKIILALKKLDPGAKWWKQKQLEKVNNALIRSQLKEKLDAATSDYARKLGVIQHSIYGVDIQPIASEISKLRSFLSLVIDENIDDTAINRGIEPLPNLEFKFVTANTLIGLPEEQGQQISMFDNYEELQLLEQLRADYLQSSGKKKEKIKERFLRVQKKAFKNEHNLFADTNSRSYKLISWNPFSNEASSWFDPQWMYGVEKFDIVIGNPPYVNVEKIDNSIKSVIKEFKTAFQKYDLYVLFYEKGLDLLSNNGVLSYITSNKFLSQGYGFKLRQLFLNFKINRIVNFNFDVFDAATVRTCIFEITKIPIKINDIKVIDVNVEADKYLFDNRTYNYIAQNIFKETDSNNFRINLTKEKIDLLKKISSDTYRVDDICSVNYGLRPSSEKLGLKKESFIYDSNKDGKYKPYFEGKDMGYWLIKKNSFLDYRPDIMYNPMFSELFENIKLVGLRTLSDIGKLRFIFDKDGYYCNDSVVILSLWKDFENVNYQTVKRLITDDKIEISKNYNLNYLQGILNSKLIKFYVNELLYDGTHFYPNHMKQLPIKKYNSNNEIESLVVEIRNKNEQYCDDLIISLDILIYKLYNLTHQEVLLIDPTFNLTEEAYNNYQV
ncbi:MAG: Eco57I restriction-modification methylase domain-containing protein [Bacteroidetes bacterium]|nr:Eco57I restriction-modification methylase domain-containing protein [Bacteroidota bacterium]MCB9042594.1 Eco57I restriction-modification methylase domain-containing protein [Chitinophagales bacterium]